MSDILEKVDLEVGSEHRDHFVSSTMFGRSSKVSDLAGN